jgi:hypothetical protein
MIRLEAFEKSDFDKLISWIDCEEMLMQFSGPAFTFPLNKEQLQNNIEDKQRVSYKVVDLATNNMIGYSEIYSWDKSSVLPGRIIIGDLISRERFWTKNCQEAYKNFI